MQTRFIKAAAATLIIFAFVTPISGKDPENDSVALMKERLPMLSQGQPKPSWQKALKAQETDFIKFISPDRILAGTLETAGFEQGFVRGIGWGLKPAEVFLLNAASGETIWAASRTVFGYPQQLLATDPVVLFQGTIALGAINPADGKQLWTRSANASRLLPGGERIILYSQKKSALSLSVLDVRDGKEVWSASVEGYPEVKGADLDVRTVGQVVIFVRSEVVAISANTGQTLWRKPFPGTAGTNAATIVLGDSLYFTDGVSITKTDPASGDSVWRQDFVGSSVRNLSMGEDNVYVVLRQGDTEESPDAVQALNLKAGKPLWKCTFDEAIQSALTIQEGRIYLTTMDHLFGIDASNGALVFKAVIPPKLQGHRLLSDLLRITADRIIMARETGVLAVQKQDGAPLYCESVEVAPFTSDYAIQKINRALESITPLKKRAEFQKQNPTSLSSIQSRSMQAYQQAAYGFIETWNQAWTAFNTGQTGYGGWIAGQMFALSEAEEAIRSGLRAGRTGIMAAEVNQAFQSHTNSLQKDFYIRPRYKVGWGWSIVIVNLNTGKRSEVLLSPDNGPLALSAPNLTAFAIDPSGSRVVTKGLGLDPARFDTYEKRVFTPRKNSIIWPYQEKWVISYPSLLSFDLALLPYGQQPESQRPLPKAIDPGKKQLNDQLINAAFQCDFDTVEKTLKAGADVNAVDEYGQTALMLAVESLQVYNKENIIAILLKQGVDLSIKDPNGWTAADHFAIMNFYQPPGKAKRGLKLLTKEREED